MKEIFLIWVVAIFGCITVIQAQCPSGEVEVTVDVITDQYGWELYWEVTPSGDPCGANTIASFGNNVVGCSGGGIQTASPTDPGAYSSSTTVTESLGCMSTATCVSIHMIDDWGDGECALQFYSDGNAVDLFVAESGNDVFTYCPSVAPQYNLQLNVDFESNGWIFNHVMPVYDPYYPVNQLSTTETFSGISLQNNGTEVINGVYVRLNIDKNNSGIWNTVYTDTIEFGTVPSGTIDYGTKEIEDSSWQEVGNYRYQYIAHHDNVDEIPSNDTLTGFFNLTDNYWSRVPLDGNGLPAGTFTFIPSSVNDLTIFKWGSFFYFPNGEGKSIDSIITKFHINNSASVTSFPYRIVVHKVILNGTTFNPDLDLFAIGGAVDTIVGIPGEDVYGIVDLIEDYNTLDELNLQDNTLYYISINQREDFAPYLNNSSNTNGLMVYGNTSNHDFHIQNFNGQSYPFYNPLFIGYGPSDEQWYSYGLTNGSEPSFGLYLSSENTVSFPELNEMPKRLIRIVNLLGQEVEYTPNTVLIYQYSDGTSEKVFTIED